MKNNVKNTGRKRQKHRKKDQKRQKKAPTTLKKWQKILEKAVIML